MAESVTLLVLPQLIEVALNCKEGIINFQALHTLLNVIVQQANLTEVGIEYRGATSEKMQDLISHLEPQTHIYPEYAIVGKKTSKRKKLSLQDVIKEEQGKAEEQKEKELRLIEQRKSSKDDPDLNPLPLKSPPGSLLGITPTELQTVVVVETQASLPQFTVTMSKVKFDEIIRDLDEVKAHVKELTDMPANMGLIEATRTNSSPIVDMFQILNLTKRMDAHEQVVEKLGSLIEDLAKTDMGGAAIDMGKLQDIKETASAAVDRASIGSKKSHDSHERRITALEESFKELADAMEESFGPGDVSDTPKAESRKSQPKAKASVQSTPSKGSSGGQPAKTPRKSKQETVTVFTPEGPYNSVIANVDLSDVSVEEAIQLIQQEFNNLKEWVTGNIQEVDKSTMVSPVGGGDGNVKFLESKMKEYGKQMEDNHQQHNQQIVTLTENCERMENEISDIVDKLQTLVPGADSTGINTETMLELANKLELLEKELLALSEQSSRLEEARIERDRQTEVLMEQIDVLKIIKANREDLEEALGEKADACQINRKVSHDQFDAACDDLSRGIEEALGKLEEQEEMWQQALENIQKEIGNKLDKMEVNPLREFVNSKLKSLQEKFKALTALKREHEAAGTKSKLLRDVTCISCDKDVVMRREMDVTMKPRPYAVPPSRNMAPYLAYELDQLRKQQKCVPGSKNLNFIENALRSKGAKTKDHLCNRYCGGSHTVTTPQQRVTRLGHFLEQWGPEIAPLNDEYVRGKDNQMYKARDEKLYQNAPVSTRGKSEDKAMMDMVPQQDRNTFINAEAEQLIQGEETSVQGRKQLNIGSIAIEHQDSISGEDRGIKKSVTTAPPEDARRASQLSADQNRASQVLPDQKRASQMTTDQKRASQMTADQKRASLVSADQKRASQASPDQNRASQALPDQNRASQALPDQNRASQALPDQNRASQALPDQNRASQALPDQNRASQALPDQNRASQASPDQKRASQMMADQKRASQVSTDQKRASQVSGDQKRASEAAVEQKRASQVSAEQRRASQQSAPPLEQKRQSQTSQNRKSSAAQ